MVNESSPVAEWLPLEVPNPTWDGQDRSVEKLPEFVVAGQHQEHLDLQMLGLCSPNEFSDHPNHEIHAL
jgi:hypothetical protein